MILKEIKYNLHYDDVRGDHIFWSNLTLLPVSALLMIKFITQSILEKQFRYSDDDILKYFSCFSQKTGFDNSCKLTPLENSLRLQRNAGPGSVQRLRTEIYN